MNEDDYDFDTTENSRLSTLFGRNPEACSSTLIYKAPKQPGNCSNNARAPSSKTFHKFIKLYNNNDGTLYGKYIIAIVTSELNPSELLLYQTKKNIFLRTAIYRESLYAYTNNNTLVLNVANQQYKLEFENSRECLDFTREYIQNGGQIETSKHPLPTQNNVKNIKVTLRENLEIDSVEDFKELVEETTNTIHEKGDILTRFERMGLPQLFPTHKENSPNWENSDSLKNDKKLGVPAVISDEVNQPRKNLSVNPQSIIKHEQTDLLTSILEENKRNNIELKEAISLLTSKLKEIIPSTESEDRNKMKGLESRIKTLELKSGNLEAELKKYHEKYGELNIAKCSQYVSEENRKDKCENSSQTDNLEFESEEIIQCELVVMQIMDIVRSLPLSSNEINKLKNVKESIKNVELISCLQSHFEFEEQSRTDVGSRNEFVHELKRIMNEMYISICSSEEDVSTKDLLAKKIKLTTVDILKSYDKSLQKTKS